LRQWLESLSSRCAKKGSSFQKTGLLKSIENGKINCPFKMPVSEIQSYRQKPTLNPIWQKT